MLATVNFTNPSTGDVLPLLLSDGLSLNEVRGTRLGSGFAPTVSFNIMYDPYYKNETPDVVFDSGDAVCNSNEVQAFALDSGGVSIPADRAVWVEILGTTDTVTDFVLTAEFS